MKTRVLSLSLALVLCLGLFTLPAGAVGTTVTVTEVVPCGKYDYIDYYSETRGFPEGMVVVKRNDKYGFVDRTDKPYDPAN